MAHGAVPAAAHRRRLGLAADHAPQRRPDLNETPSHTLRLSEQLKLGHSGRLLSGDLAPSTVESDFPLRWQIKEIHKTHQLTWGIRAVHA